MLSISSTLKPHIPLPSKSFKKLEKFDINKNLISSRRVKVASFRSELGVDAPFAAAIGACVLTSLVSPIKYNNEFDDENNTGGPIDSHDTRFVVMGIIILIHCFNWMSWVFAWLDTRKQWYLISSAVYLAPYMSSTCPSMSHAVESLIPKVASDRSNGFVPLTVDTILNGEHKVEAVVNDLVLNINVVMEYKALNDMCPIEIKMQNVETAYVASGGCSKSIIDGSNLPDVDASDIWCKNNVVSVCCPTRNSFEVLEDYAENENLDFEDCI